MPPAETPLAAPFHDPAVSRHEVSPGHPEGPDRVAAVVRAIDAELGPERWKRPARRSESEILEAIDRVHDPGHVERFRRACERLGRGYLDTPDCPFSPASFEAATAAVSLALSAADEVLDGRLRRAFVVARPPGHHARPGAAMGFCFFNTIAVAAAHLRARGLERVLVLDWDVHHGNGTQEIFWTSDRVMYASTHRWPFYPGSGAADEVGEGAGRGFTANFPMKAGAGDGDFGRIFSGPLADAADRFRPEFVLVSAGFDAHRDDPLGGMAVTEEGFAAWTRASVAWAEAWSGGRYLSLLEGGYDRGALGRSAVAHFRTLLEPPGFVRSAAEGCN